MSNDREKEIMMLINIDKGDTMIYHIQDSLYNAQYLIRQKDKDVLTKELSPFDREKYRLNHFFKEDGGIIKNAKNAADIAYIYLKNLYGEKEIKNELPFNVYSVDKYWFIEGTFNTGNLGIKSGGVVEILIDRIDGRIIHVTHGK